MENIDNTNMKNAKSIYDNINSSNLICDLNYNIIWVNNFTLKNFPNICVGKNIKDIFPIYDFDKIYDMLSNGFPCETNDMHLNFYSLSLLFTPILESENLSSILVTLKSSENIDNLYSIEVDRVIASVAGQFRSPLFSVFNLLAPLSRRLEEYELYEDIDYIKHIAKNCYKMIKSTVNLSEYFKLSNINLYKLNFKKVNMNKFLGDLCKSIQIMFTSSNDIRLEYSITSENLIINMDTEKFSIAFFNIIANSCTYTSPGNVIKVSLEKINDNAIISISDSGVGIHRENLYKSFEPYFSYDPSTNNFNSSGIGLGLTIVKKVVESHNGSYILDSVHNKGTNLVIKLPIDNNYDIYDTPCVESNTANYIANKFSPLYIFLADLCDFNLF